MKFPLIHPVPTALGVFCADDKGVPIVIDSNNFCRYDQGAALTQIFARGVHFGRAQLAEQAARNAQLEAEIQSRKTQQGELATRVAQLDAEIRMLRLRHVLDVGRKSSQIQPFCSAPPPEEKDKGEAIADEPVPIPVIIEESSADLVFDLSRMAGEALARFIPSSASASCLSEAISRH